NATSVPLWQRIGYVKDTIALLADARQLSGGQVYVVNWIAGVVDARLPALFGQGSAAREQLNWCAANVERAPPAGWSREVYRQLALLRWPTATRRRPRITGDAAATPTCSAQSS